VSRASGGKPSGAYALLPLSAFSREAQAGRLKYAPLEKPRVTRQPVLATRPGNGTSRASQALRLLVHQEIAAPVSAGRWTAKLMFDPADQSER